MKNRKDSGLMTIRELAEYLKVSEKAAYRHAVGGAWRLRRSEIDRWIEGQPAGQNKLGSE